MNRRELLIGRLRGLEAAYTRHETILNLTLEEGGTGDLTKKKIAYILEQYEKWQQELDEECKDD